MLRDRPFVALCGVFVLATMPSAIMMMLLAVYAKENFGVPESQYGFIMATNAAMVVLFQYAVTREPAVAAACRCWRRARALCARRWQRHVGRRLLGLLAQHGHCHGRRAADRAHCHRRGRESGPAEMRGRYMGIDGLSWSVGFGIGPVVAGWLNDNVAPRAISIFALATGLMAAAGFLLLRKKLAGRPGYAGQTALTTAGQ